MITAFIKGQDLTISTPMIVSGSLDYLTLQAVFQSSDWEGMEKWVHFSKGEISYSSKLENDKVEESKHLNLSEGEWKVYFHGMDSSGKRITTDQEIITVQPTGLIDGKNPLPEIPLSSEEQISLTASEAKRIAQSVRDDANAGKFNGAAPVVGVDYWTEADKQEIVNDVLTHFPVWEGGSF